MDNGCAQREAVRMPGRVGVVIPLYNEGAAAADLARRMPHVVATTFVVDDGSTDGGDALAERAGATIVRHGRNRGIGAAIRSGLDAAVADRCDVVVVMAGNGKDRPEEIPLLLAKIDEGYDYVQGSRFARGGHSVNLPFARGLLIRAFTVGFRLLTGFAGSDVTNGFRAYRLSVLDDPRIRVHQPWLDRYELEYYVHWKVITLGYRICEIPVSKTYPARRHSYSKIRPVVDWWHIVRPVLLLALHVRT
jgi:dolichol-phosphate mannosyltransferase